MKFQGFLAFIDYVIKVGFITKVRYKNFGNYFKRNLNLLSTLFMFVYPIMFEIH